MFSSIKRAAESNPSNLTYTLDSLEGFSFASPVYPFEVPAEVVHHAQRRSAFDQRPEMSFEDFLEACSISSDDTFALALEKVACFKKGVAYSPKEAISVIKSAWNGISDFLSWYGEDYDAYYRRLEAKAPLKGQKSKDKGFKYQWDLHKDTHGKGNTSGRPRKGELYAVCCVLGLTEAEAVYLYQLAGYAFSPLKDIDCLLSKVLLPRLSGHPIDYLDAFPIQDADKFALFEAKAW